MYRTVGSEISQRFSRLHRSEREAFFECRGYPERSQAGAPWRGRVSNCGDLRICENQDRGCVEVVGDQRICENQYRGCVEVVGDQRICENQDRGCVEVVGDQKSGARANQGPVGATVFICMAGRGRGRRRALLRRDDEVVEENSEYEDEDGFVQSGGSDDEEMKQLEDIFTEPVSEEQPGSVMEEGEKLHGKMGEGDGTKEDADFEQPVTDPRWKWPRYKSYFYQGRQHNVKLADKVAEKEKGEKTPFKVTYVEREGRENTVSVTLFSSHLIEIAKEILPNSKAVFSQEPAIDGRDLFLVRIALRERLEKSSCQGLARWHLDHLLRFVEEEYRDTIVRWERMHERKCVSWDMLWTFLIPHEIVSYKCEMSSQPLCGIVDSCKYKKSATMGKVFVVKLKVMDYNIRSYRECHIERAIPEFSDEISFVSESLDVCPLAFVDNREKLETKFYSTGESFYHLQMQKPFRFMHYEGSLSMYEHTGYCRMLVKHRADGRVMVDLRNFARMNPSYSLGNAAPPSDILRGKRTSMPDIPKPPADLLKLSPATVWGFSFALKKWGCFEVSGFKDIQYYDRAFNDLLVMNPRYKETLFSLVSQYVKKGDLSNQNTLSNDSTQSNGVAPILGDLESSKVDPIPDKGAGCIFLCYGPPGTGKTLTAESLAEKLRVPLWSVSLAELPSYSPEVLESRLRQIFEIACSWRAILLFDEADVYLARRSEVDSRQNSLTGVFLRLLEYFTGVLFLTTNRITSFDDAFRSRISLFLHYPALSHQNRAEIWGKLLVRAGVTGVSTKQLDELTKIYPFNGREIRNNLVVAQTLAESRGGELTFQDVELVVQMAVESTQALQDVTFHGKGQQETGFGAGLSNGLSLYS